MNIDNIYFLRPGENKISNYVLGLICDRIRNSTSVSLCVAYFTHIEIADALIERTQAKKKTRIILNLADILRPEGNDTSVLKTSQALVNIFNSLGHQADSTGSLFQMKTLGRDKSMNSQMHHKFAIFDNVIVFGSLNFTFQAFNLNFENVHLSSENYLVGAFESEFEDLWVAGKDFFVQDGKIRSLECPVCKCSDGVDFESYGACCTFCSHKFDGTGF